MKKKGEGVVSNKALQDLGARWLPFCVCTPHEGDRQCLDTFGLHGWRVASFGSLYRFFSCRELS